MGSKHGNGVGPGATSGGHGVLVANGGCEDRAERNQEDRDDQRHAPLRGTRRRAALATRERMTHAPARSAHAAISTMRTTLPQSSVSRVISTASGR